MSQANPFTIDDGKSSPQAHTFVPYNEDAKGVWTFCEKTGIPLGDPQVTLSTRKTDLYEKGRLLLAVPVVVQETINGVVVPKVVRMNYLDIQSSFSRASTTEERNDCMRLAANMIGGSVAMIDDMFVGTENIF